MALTAAYDMSEEIFISRTDPNAKYTHIVTESDYLEDFRDGWEYALRHFVEQYKERLQQHPNKEYLKKNKSILYDTIYSSSSLEKKLIVEDEQSERNQED